MLKRILKKILQLQQYLQFREFLLRLRFDRFRCQLKQQQTVSDQLQQKQEAHMYNLLYKLFLQLQC